MDNLGMDRSHGEDTCSEPLPSIFLQPISEVFSGKIKWPVGELAILGEGISFLMGCSKNYIMYWGGYIHYNSIGQRKSLHKDTWM